MQGAQKSKVLPIGVNDNLRVDLLRGNASGRKTREHGVKGVRVGNEADSLRSELLWPKKAKGICIDKSGILVDAGDYVRQCGSE